MFSPERQTLKSVGWMGPDDHSQHAIGNEIARRPAVMPAAAPVASPLRARKRPSSR